MRTVRLGGLQWGKVFGGGVQAEKGIRWREVVGYVPFTSALL